MSIDVLMSITTLSILMLNFLFMALPGFTSRVSAIEGLEKVETILKPFTNKSWSKMQIWRHLSID